MNEVRKKKDKWIKSSESIYSKKRFNQRYKSKKKYFIDQIRMKEIKNFVTTMTATIMELDQD